MARISATVSMASARAVSISAVRRQRRRRRGVDRHGGGARRALLHARRQRRRRDRLVDRRACAAASRSTVVERGEPVERLRIVRRRTLGARLSLDPRRRRPRRLGLADPHRIPAFPIRHLRPHLEKQLAEDFGRRVLAREPFRQRRDAQRAGSDLGGGDGASGALVRSASDRSSRDGHRRISRDRQRRAEGRASPGVAATDYGNLMQDAHARQPEAEHLLRPRLRTPRT